MVVRRHQRGAQSPGRLTTGFLCFIAVITAVPPAWGDPTFGAVDRAFGAIPPVAPDVPPRSGPPVSGHGQFRPSWDLDGFYLWLGPSGTASYVGDAWDSAFGADLAALRVREAAPIAALGGAFGFSKFTAHDGGRLWLDLVAGTRVGGRTMAGLTAGPLLEVSDLTHPRAGASIGAWAFVGVTPFVRVGVVSTTGAFIEIGLHIALPVLRW